ncbi:hypothetical protein DF186_15605, partial [Enterococcus hirae]
AYLEAEQTEQGDAVAEHGHGPPETASERRCMDRDARSAHDHDRQVTAGDEGVEGLGGKRGVAGHQQQGGTRRARRLRQPLGMGDGCRLDRDR